MRYWYIFTRFADIFAGRDSSRAFAALSAADRAAMLDILAMTKPGFANVLAKAGR